MGYIEGMARPKVDIRAKVRTRDGIQMIHLDEYPGHWIVSPERDRERAIAWAKRNRDRLINYSNATIADYCKDLYKKDGLWVQRQKDKGHKYGDLHLKNRQAYLDNYLSRVFGHLKPQDIDRPEFRRLILKR